MTQFVFNLNNDFLITAASEVRQISENVILEQKNAPEKFKIAFEGCENMLKRRPVTQKHIQNILDVIGGYFVATVTQQELRPTADQTDVLNHAKELMRFADVIVETCQPVWKLSIV